MTALTEFLFPAPAERSAGGILRWWESRRLHYNAIVGGTGLVSLGTSVLFLSLPPDPLGIPGSLMIPVVTYGVMANLCYLLGPAAEIAIEKLWRGRVLPTGPTLFRMGLTFSIGLTLLPILFAIMGWLFRVAGLVF